MEQKKLLYDWILPLAMIAIIAMVVVSLIRGCEESKPVIVTIPEKSGKFELSKPDETKIVTVETIKYLTKSVNSESDKKEIEFLQEQLSKLILESENDKSVFEKANDSLKQVLYNKSVQITESTKTFEDSIVKIDVLAIAKGEVKNIAVSYVRKEQKVKVQPKETFLRVLAGTEIGNNTSFSNPIFKANLMLQNEKGNILTTSYDANQNFYLGYNFSIFNIKK